MEKFILEIKMQQISLYIPEHANLKLVTFLNMEDFWRSHNLSKSKGSINLIKDVRDQNSELNI